MDDFNTSCLSESKNEWGVRLITILTPLIFDGFMSIFDEAIKLCEANDELPKYLMTFQNFITRIPKWNESIIENETNRIRSRSSCNYIEELITCVHIIHLKVLTAVRAGHEQKKIDIAIPTLETFIHKIYTNAARQIYKNVYLFERGNVSQLTIQKNNREIEIIIRECILVTIRDSIPIEHILRAYTDETVDTDVTVTEEIVEEPIIDESPKDAVTDVDVSDNIVKDDKSSVSFNNVVEKKEPDPPAMPIIEEKPSVTELEEVWIGDDKKINDDERVHISEEEVTIPINFDTFDDHVKEEEKNKDDELSFKIDSLSPL